MREAALYEVVDEDKVCCHVCNHGCIIQTGHTGLCAVRYNDNNVLYATSYGKAISAAIDPVEKKPFYHFLPGSQTLSIATVGCNFACLFCQNDDISQYPKEHSGEIPGFDLSPEAVVKKAIENDCSSIAYTYTEPSVFLEYAHDTAKLAHLHDLKNIFVSNGYMTRAAIDYIYQYLDAINIDLKSFDDAFYQKVCAARLEPVLENIKTFHELGICLEITTLLIPTENDSRDNLEKIANFISSLDTQIPWHISRFYPAYKMKDLPATSFEKLQEAYEIGKKAGLKNVYIGNYPTRDYESSYCSQCNNLIIEREGSRIKSFLKKGKCPKCNNKFVGVLS